MSDLLTEIGTLDVDVPVDVSLDGALRLAISANKREVRLGDVIQYTIEVQNTAAVAIQQTEIFNDLPRGLELIGGSVLLEGGPLADPALNGQGQFVFPIGTLSPNEKVSVVYAARILPSAGNGDKINRAVAEGGLVGFGTSIASNTDSVTVVINNDGGVFSREGVVLGKVFLDCDANGVQNGLDYSLSQLDPRTHVLDIRESSLPAGTRAEATRVLDAGRGGSRFVSLQAGEIRTEDFAVSGSALRKRCPNRLASIG